MAARLRRQGHCVNRKGLRHWMRLKGFGARYRKTKSIAGKRGALVSPLD